MTSTVVAAEDAPRPLVTSKATRTAIRFNLYKRWVFSDTSPDEQLEH